MPPNSSQNLPKSVPKSPQIDPKGLLEPIWDRWLEKNWIWRPQKTARGAPRVPKERQLGPPGPLKWKPKTLKDRNWKPFVFELDLNHGFAVISERLWHVFWSRNKSEAKKAKIRKSLGNTAWAHRIGRSANQKNMTKQFKIRWKRLLLSDLDFGSISDSFWNRFGFPKPSIFKFFVMIFGR